jgi:chromosome segregation ATPase
MAGEDGDRPPELPGNEKNRAHLLRGAGVRQMLIENMMYFALGVLVAGLLALIILPAVWKRAVRLTKRRIEAATPITMAEFRADKDQLRAEFALTTRRLEVNIETLRAKLTESLADVNQKRADVATLQAEREQHLRQIAELEGRQKDLLARVAELEREGTEFVERLQTRDGETQMRAEELGKLRETIRTSLPPGLLVDLDTLSGDYAQDIERLSATLLVQSRRAAFLEDQARSLLERLENSDRRSAETVAAIAAMREALSISEDSKSADADSLLAAEARIASAESRLNALLAETGNNVEISAGRTEQLLADKLTQEAELESLRNKVANVESAILADWDTERLEEAQLREKLNDIAANVGRLVYAVETETPLVANDGESLFDRVQRFADNSDFKDVPVQPARGERKGGVSDRMAAIREIQGR